MKMVRAQAFWSAVPVFLLMLLVCWLIEYLFGSVVLSKGGYQITTYLFFTHEYVISVPEITHYMLVPLLPVSVFGYVYLRGIYRYRSNYEHGQFTLAAVCIAIFLALFTISASPLTLAGYDLMFGVLAGLVLGVLFTPLTDTLFGMFVSATFGTVYYVFWAICVSPYKLESFLFVPGIAVTLLIVSGLLCACVPMVWTLTEIVFSFGSKLYKGNESRTCELGK